MCTLGNELTSADLATPLPPFLRKWSIEESPLAHYALHDHLALIFENQDDQLDIVVPFLRLGLERNEKCVYILDDSAPEVVVAAMEHHGIDVGAAIASGALAIITKNDAYLKNGYFDPDWMVCYLAQAVHDAQKEGFRGVRASGEMTWALGSAGHPDRRLIEYECKVNTFFPNHDMAGLCQYNRRRFSPEILMHVIHTHPRIVFGREICENPYYIPPEIFDSFSSGTGDPVACLLETMADYTRLRRHLNS